MSSAWISFINGKIIENANALDFIGNLNESKKSFTLWTEKDLNHRKEILLSLAIHISENAEMIAEKMGQAQALPKKFLLETEILKVCQLIESRVKNFHPTEMRSPTGTILILIPARLNFRFLMDILSSALLAGNTVYIKPSKKDFYTSKFISETMGFLFGKFSEKDLPRSLVQVFQGEDEVADLMVSHPSIKAIAFQGKKEVAEKINALAHAQWKKLMIMGGYHNSALILPDADLSVVIPELVESCFRGLGNLRWNMTNILITEAQLPEFEKNFAEELEKTCFDHYLAGEEEQAQKSYDQLMSEEKKIIWQGKIPGWKVQPTVVKDLSHCSVLQQDCLLAPVVLVSAVKYVHEMAKWANTGYYAQAAQIFGSQEKALNMAAKLDAGVIFINNWYASLNDLGFGYKQSSYGLTNSSPIGELFSDAKKLTT